MRVSSNTFYDAGISAMQRQNAKLLQVQQQIASGKRMLTPADDPIGAAQALEVTQSQSINTQYGTNSGTANDSIALEESVLGSITSLLQDVKTVAVNAGNGVLNKNDRAGLASDLASKYQALLGLANTVDSSGQYLFSGYQGSVRPFFESAPGVVGYSGDQGQRLIQISDSRQIAVSDAGSDVFQRIASGNGSFVTATGSNTGSGVIDQGTVLETAKWSNPANSKDLSIKFAVNAGVTSYDIIDNISGNSLLTGAAPGAAPYPRVYANGANISLQQVGPPAFDFGAQVSITGVPANGDTFSIKPSTHQDMFKMIDDLAQLLKTNTTGAALTNQLSAAQTNLNNAMENVLFMRFSAGARLNEIDTVAATRDNRALQDSTTLSRLQDVDFAQAAAQLTQQQVNLEAAQKSFANVAGLSLFTYL
jgi:flagellar hook-associated protein 3 FlgL